MFQERGLRLPDHRARILRVLLVVLLVLGISACGGLVSHKVNRGESLYSIGFYYGHDYLDIAEWNDIPPPYIISEGQWLRVAPPDEQWWDEQRKIASNQRFSKKNTKNTQSKRMQSGPAKLDRKISSNANKSNKKKRPKNIIVEDFTDKSGKINHWVWPTRGRLVDPDKKFSQRNKGINISGRRGQLVYATAAGKVVYSGSGLIGYGQLIIIKHNKTYLSAYAHNEKILVKEGDIVKRGQQIAHMGRTPDNHIQLHFEIRQNGKPVDPLRFLKK